MTRQHRYGYSVHNQFAARADCAMLKHDFSRGTSELHALPPGWAASEGVFVPIGAGEDEGYVIAPVYDSDRGLSELRVLDAQRWTAPPVARIELPVRIPFGLHGDFITRE